jgi:hypothetical protein
MLHIAFLTNKTVTPPHDFCGKSTLAADCSGKFSTSYLGGVL